MIINQGNLADLRVAFNAAFNTGFRDTPINWDKVATPVNSTTDTEHYAWLGQFPRLRKWVGDRVVKQMQAYDYRVKNDKFEATIEVKREDIEDDKYGVYNPMFQEMGWAAKTHPEELVWDSLALGDQTPCYDGQYFFDTDHPVGNADTGTTSVSNFQSGAGTPWFLLDVRRPLKPLIFQKRREYDFRALVDLNDSQVFKRDSFEFGVDARVATGFGFWQQAFASQATLNNGNFDTAYAGMMALKSDEGRKLGIMPNLLVCGPSNRANALEAIMTERNAAGASNYDYKAVDVLIVPWLS
jgi:phage major head subunit gpT-like protein